MSAFWLPLIIKSMGNLSYLQIGFLSAAPPLLSVVGMLGSALVDGPVAAYRAQRRGRCVRRFMEAVKAAKLDPRFTFHKLRHIWARLTIMAAAPLMVVAQNLGHRDTPMVERHSDHLADSYVTETLRKTAPTLESANERKAVPLTRWRVAIFFVSCTARQPNHPTKSIAYPNYPAAAPGHRVPCPTDVRDTRRRESATVPRTARFCRRLACPRTKGLAHSCGDEISICGI